MYFKKFIPAFALALCAATANSMLPVQAFASDHTADTLAASRFTYEEDGSVSYYEDGAPVVGKFMLAPELLLGDVNSSGTVDAQDAAALLQISAQIGAGNTVFSDADMAHLLTFGDIDGNGTVNALDAAFILSYSASAGAGGSAVPLGAAYYYADAQGRLLTGHIEAPDGKSYIAGEDFRLLSNTWYTDVSGTYVLGNDCTVLKSTWVSKNGHSVWMDASGCMAAGEWAVTDKGLCWFDTDGMAADGLRVLDGKAYYFADCTIQTGWISYGGRICYAGTGGALCTGLTEIGGETYCFGEAYELQTGWISFEEGLRYFDENGRMCTGWMMVDGVSYCFDDQGLCIKGFLSTDEGICYLDESGSRCTGWQLINNNVYYFVGDSALMVTGWTTINGMTYYFDPDGIMHTGWLELDGKTYYFQEEDGIMATGHVQVDGKTYDFGNDGVSRGEYIPPSSNTGTGRDDLLNNAVLSPRRTITVYDQQKASGKQKVDFTFTLKDRDIEIIEQFAAEHFPENSSIAEKLYITHQWIHYNTDYAYAGAKWNEIVGLSYVDAIFNHKKGQCVQYNGAMASVLAYYGYEVYMVKGYTRPGVQHFWTQVEIDGHTYMVETGNSGKNGDSWQYFFKQMD